MRQWEGQAVTVTCKFGYSITWKEITKLEYLDSQIGVNHKPKMESCKVILSMKLGIHSSFSW